MQGSEIMTTTAPTVTEIFADAKHMHSEALKQLAAGDIRDAAEKAWCATKRATDALILARTGELPRTTGMTTDGLDELAKREPAVKDGGLVGRYYSRIGQLHGACFYDGRCNMETERRIRETDRYIDDAERLNSVWRS